MINSNVETARNDLSIFMIPFARNKHANVSSGTAVVASACVASGIPYKSSLWPTEQAELESPEVMAVTVLADNLKAFFFQTLRHRVCFFCDDFIEVSKAVI